MFQSFNVEVYEKNFFFSWIFKLASVYEKWLILQHIWLYIMISSSKKIRPMLRISYISVYFKLNFLTFYQIILTEISQCRLDVLTMRNINIYPDML